MFATLAVNKLEQYLKDTNSDNMKYNFMLGVGFKNPHLQVSNIYILIYACEYMICMYYASICQLYYA